MTLPSLIRVGPIARISLGLITMLISLILLADLMLGVTPDRLHAERQSHQRIAENLALQITALIQAGDDAMVGKTIQQVLGHDQGIRAISVRSMDGTKVLRRGLVLDPTEARSAVNLLSVPIVSGQRPWGEVEVRFADSAPKTMWSWATQPAVQLLFVLGVGGFSVCYLYLHRAMRYLDPAAAVPDRVRRAFDTLTEGVVILDQQARIVLANRAFRQLNPQSGDDLNGRQLDALTWLTLDPPAGGASAAPWTQSLTSSVTADAVPYTALQADGSISRLLLTSAPITDAKGRSRGCMVTFDDVTPVHRSNDELRQALASLERSRELIEAKNLELVELATRDSLTGCLNRRAFFEAAEKAFDHASQLHGELCCLMVDIDHFKKFNDLHGHAVGDQVIQVVARALAAGTRPSDIVCRYGGEEFCIVLPGASRAVAMEVAERLRSKIESDARASIRGTQVEKVTTSIGLSTRVAGLSTLQQLIEQADTALYQSKRAGRNRVTVFDREATPEKTG